MRNDNSILGKKYEELIKLDKELIINALNISRKSTIYSVIEDLVMDFINKEVDERIFQDKDKSLGEIVVNLKTESNINLDYLLNIIYKMDIKPYVLFVCDESNYCMHFGVNEEFVINRWSDYLKLIVDCIKYINSKCLDAIISNISMDGDYYMDINNKPKVTNYLAQKQQR